MKNGYLGLANRTGLVFIAAWLVLTGCSTSDDNTDDAAGSDDTPAAINVGIYDSTVVENAAETAQRSSVISNLDLQSAFWVINFLVLGFLFGERAMRNVMPFFQRRFQGDTAQTIDETKTGAVG